MAVPMHSDHEIDEAWLYIQSAIERWEAWASHYPPEHRIGHLSDASIARGYLKSFLGHARRDRETVRELLEEIENVAYRVEADRDDMGCNAGNWDGGSPESCEHCQAGRYLERLRALITKATGS